MARPDWQLPVGVDRGLWDYLHSQEMVQGYDQQIAASALASADVAYCRKQFPHPRTFVDLGCGTGRLAITLARLGFRCTGVDLSPVMLAQAQRNATAAGVTVDWREANLCDLSGLAPESFAGGACLFSTLGMIRGRTARVAALQAMFTRLQPGGRLVLHAHDRWYHGLGWRKRGEQLLRTLLGRETAGDVTMPQAYGGAPLTLHHFTRTELRQMARDVGFRIVDWVSVDAEGHPAGRWPGQSYGVFLTLERPA